MIYQAAELWEKLKVKRPLVHCITNYVTINDVANILLAAGASPAMVEHEQDAGGFARLAGAVYLNVGSLTQDQELAINGAVLAAREEGIPLVLDPVACGVIMSYRRTCQMIMESKALSIVKGNQAEIKSLAGIDAKVCGVDSLDEGEGVEAACHALYKNYRSVVVASGAQDLVVGERTARISNGTALFQAITGAGCMLGAVIAACVAASPDDPWMAGLTATLAFNIAGEKAAVQSSGPGSFRINLMDKLYSLKGHDIVKEGLLEC
ncbi:MAG: hydroxyethylthiazole kinase [Syntrophomonadaceae bacterium]